MTARVADVAPTDPAWEYPQGEGRRSAAGELLVLPVDGGRSIRVVEEPDYDLGRVYYRVEKVGTFTLTMDDHHEVYDVTKTDEHGYRRGYRTAAERGYVMKVHYGRKDRIGYQSGYDPLPDAVTLFGVVLTGGSVYTARDLLDDKTWLAVSRATGPVTSVSVPEGTRRRATAIVRALTAHWLERPDRARLDARARARRASARISSACRDIANIEAQIEKLREQADRWRAYEATQQERLGLFPDLVERDREMRAHVDAETRRLYGAP